MRRRGYQVPTLPSSGRRLTAVGTLPRRLSNRGASTNTLLVGRARARHRARGAHLHKGSRKRGARWWTVLPPTPSTMPRRALATSATTIVLRRIDALTPGDDAEIARAITDDQHSLPRPVDRGDDALCQRLCERRSGAHLDADPAVPRTVEVPPCVTTPEGHRDDPALAPPNGTNRDLGSATNASRAQEIHLAQ